ncbi:N/A [soil metagenome]
MENKNSGPHTTIPTSIAPWLTVFNGANAAAFYKTAFGAVETYRLEDPDGSVIARLSVNGAEFWISGGTAGNADTPASQDGAIRMILTVTDPDAFFAKALAAGATEVFPVSEDYGWRLGRLVDPYGHHWEIGRPLDT